MYHWRIEWRTTLFPGLRKEMAETPDRNCAASALKTDTHSPGEYRSDTVRNVDRWYEIYKVAPGDKLYLKPESRRDLVTPSVRVPQLACAQSPYALLKRLLLARDRSLLIPQSNNVE
jgi:hypothetical protein